MEFACIKKTVQAPKPETRYAQATPDESAQKAAFDTAAQKFLQPGETFQDKAAAQGGEYPVVFEGYVTFAGEKQGLGRCSVCRDNARERWALKASDEHGVKKWCAICLRDAFGLKVGAVV